MKSKMLVTLKGRKSLLRLADVYLTYAEACLGNSEELAGGPAWKH